MKISYTGRLEEFTPKQRAKLEAKIQKLSKLLERRGEKETHVILMQERFLHKVEITINAWDHALVGIGADNDLVVAANTALDRLEKQVLKLRNRFRDTKRHKDKEAAVSPAGAEPPTPAKAGKREVKHAAKATGGNRKKIFRVNHRDGNKPMTLDEAMLEMEAEQEYMVYRDAQTDRVHVLMRRPDGHFDLIES
jgi:putative sigma-54 modulation protein